MDSNEQRSFRRSSNRFEFLIDGGGEFLEPLCIQPEKTSENVAKGIATYYSN